MERRPRRRVSLFVVAGLIAVNGLFASIAVATFDYDALDLGVAEFALALIAFTASFGILRILVAATPKRGAR